MIEEMRLRGLGVIAEATLTIGAGFTAITGETGAGKTMVVTGLGLLLGQRADSGTVRADSADVAGVWVIPEHGPVADRVREAGGELEPIGNGRAELYVGRTVTSEGRSRASVGGRAAPASVLADLAQELVALHGQSDQLRLRSSAAQRDALDRFGGAEVGEALTIYRTLWEQWRALDDRLRGLVEARDERVAEASALRDALAEIEEIDPQPGEDVELAQRAERLANVEELRAAAASARELLSSEVDASDVGVLLSEARRGLERASDRDALLGGYAEQLAELGYRAAELAGDLSAYLADLDEAGPQELDAVETRRAAIGGLIRRHGNSLEEVLSLASTGALRLAELEGDDDRVALLTGERDNTALELDAAATTLTEARRAAATRLGAAATEELAALAMPDAVLSVGVRDATPSAFGRDEVVFLLAPHPGADPRPVAKSASGGELSRVMLAIEVVIAAVDAVPTFIFDEIDAGIGGAAAIEVGRRLRRLAESSQVIVVTHLAQVAAFADNHLSVLKQNDGSVTSSSVRRLDGAEREAEMARLLSGLADSDSALSHARELLALAHS